MSNKGQHIDKIFKEKLSNLETPLEEDNWLFIEQNIKPAAPSFYRFGWGHINIYNTTSTLALLLVGGILFFNLPEKDKTEKILPETESIQTILPQKSDSTSAKVTDLKVEKSPTAKKTTTNLKEEIVPSQENNLYGNPKDSVPNITKEEIINLKSEPEPVKNISEKKPKRIIYVVQQDTIVEKDTVKVRRKRTK